MTNISARTAFWQPLYQYDGGFDNKDTVFIPTKWAPTKGLEYSTS